MPRPLKFPIVDKIDISHIDIGARDPVTFT